MNLSFAPTRRSQGYTRVMETWKGTGSWQVDKYLLEPTCTAKHSHPHLHFNMGSVFEVGMARVILGLAEPHYSLKPQWNPVELSRRYLPPHVSDQRSNSCDFRYAQLTIWTLHQKQREIKLAKAVMFIDAVHVVHEQAWCEGLRAGKWVWKDELLSPFHDFGDSFIYTTVDRYKIFHLMKIRSVTMVPLVSRIFEKLRYRSWGPLIVEALHFCHKLHRPIPAVILACGYLPWCGLTW